MSRAEALAFAPASFRHPPPVQFRQEPVDVRL